MSDPGQYSAKQYPAMHKLNPAMASNAVKAMNLEWGSDRQVYAQKKAYELAVTEKLLTDWQERIFSSKNSTSEMMDWIEELAAEV